MDLKKSQIDKQPAGTSITVHKPKKPAILNKVSENPWRNDAPTYFTRNIKKPRNYIYDVLDYDTWQRFKKYQVLEVIMNTCKEGFFKKRCWRQLYSFLYINPMDAITEKDLQYIYECVYQMSSQEIEDMLRCVKVLMSLNLHDLQLASMVPPTMPPSALQHPMFQSMTREQQQNFLVYVGNYNMHAAAVNNISNEYAHQQVYNPNFFKNSDPYFAYPVVPRRKAPKRIL